MYYSREIIREELLPHILGAGLRPFLAERGTHGFYTDEGGTAVVSFQVNYGVIGYSGNYISKKCGTGWAMTEHGHYYEPTKELLLAMLSRHPPSWATKNEPPNSEVRRCTLTAHLERYQKSSKYSEVFK
jgi:hypothetical protein